MTEKQFLKVIGQKIKSLREAQGISVQDLAQMTEISRMQLYRIEDGENPTSILILRRISKELGVKLSKLID